MQRDDIILALCDQRVMLEEPSLECLVLIAQPGQLVLQVALFFILSA